MGSTYTREDLHHYLERVSWPAAPALLAGFIREKGGPAELLEEVSQLPNRIYMSEKDLWSELQALRTSASGR